jgi:hypothetical protein
MKTTNIATKLKAAQLVPLSAALGIVAVAFPSPAIADPLPFGPDTCINGYVWREARVGDTVCVTPATRTQVGQQNANAGANKDPSQAYGPESCSQGYVWREAFDGDTICVTPAVRSSTLADNAAAASRRATTPAQPTPQGTTVVFEVTGPGEVFNIVTDPDTGAVPDHTALPFTKTATIGPDTHLLQVVATGRDNPGPGCRILLNGKVVAQEPIGGNAHCIFSLP